MDTLNTLFQTIFASPVANLLIVAGLFFLGIAVVGNISGKIQPGVGGRLLSGLLGLCLLGGGLIMYVSTPPGIDLQLTPTLPSPSNSLSTSVPATDVQISIISPTSAPPTLTSVPPLPNEEYVDTGTQEQGMHACPVGFAIAGVHLESNLFLCRRVVHYGNENYVMTIFDAGPGTQRADMHACPDGTYMRGLRADQNNLLCSYDSRRGQPQDWLTEFEDTSSQDYGMHTCPATSGNISFLTGIRADQNRFLCGIYNP